MSAVTAALIKELRDRTGVAMNKCKEALEATGGNMQDAIDHLRKLGIASAVKKEGRETKEGAISFAENNEAVAIIEMSAETDFVVKNETFRIMLDMLAKQILKTKPATLEALMEQPYEGDASLTVDQYRTVVMQSLGENIKVKRMLILDKKANSSLGVYSHGGKILSIVEVEGSQSEEVLARDIAMHVAAAKPEYLNAESVPANIIEKEQEIARSQITNKPAAIIENIVKGKVEAFFKLVCLTNQEYVKEPKFSVNDIVGQRSKEIGKTLSLASFLRWTVGE